MFSKTHSSIRTVPRQLQKCVASAVVVIIRGLPFRRITCSLRTVTLSVFSAISPMPPQWWMVTSSTRTPDDAVAWMAGECRFWVKTPLNVRIVPTGGRARTNRVWSS